MTVNFRRIGSRVMGFVNGQMLNKEFENTSDAEIAESILREYKNTGDEALWNNIESLFFPHKRLLKGDHLEVRNGRVFAKGSKIPMPSDLADFMMQIVESGDDAIEAYVNFWKLACLAPPKARDSLFGFVKNHGIIITDNGYMLLYKAAMTKERRDPSTDLARFVAEKYVDLVMHGQNPHDYFVWKGESGYEARYGHSGDPLPVDSVGKLMTDLQHRRGEFQRYDQTETVYTDLWSQSMDIRLGVQQYKDPAECDFDSHSPCGHGLHVGAESYVKSYGGYNQQKAGDENEIIYFLVLVNPKDVVRAFSNEDKMGVSAYLPIGIMTQEDGTWRAIEQRYVEFDYIDYEVEELQARYKEIESGFWTTPLSEDDFRLAEEQSLIITQRIADLTAIKPEIDTELERTIAPHDRPAEESEGMDDSDDFEDDFDDDDDDDWGEW